VLPAAVAPDIARRRRQVVVYVALTLGFSFAFETWMIRAAGGLAALGGFAMKLEPYLAGEQGVFSIVGYGPLVLWLRQTGRLRRATEAQAAAP
jgi:hypothetical protein